MSNSVVVPVETASRILEIRNDYGDVIRHDRFTERYVSHNGHYTQVGAELEQDVNPNGSPWHYQ